MKLMKRFISLALVAIMLMASLMSIGVFASEAESSDGGQDEFDIIREKYRTYLTAEGMEYSLDDPIIADNIKARNEKTEEYYSTMNLAEDAEYLWEDISDNSATQYTTSYITLHYDRLIYLAVTYCTKGAELYQSEELKNAIIFGLDWTYENRYNENRTPTGNWWDWEVGCPLSLCGAVIAMYEHLSEEQIENYMNAVGHFMQPISDRYTGCNRMYVVNTRLLRAIIIKSAEEIEKCIAGMDESFRFVNNGNGFFTDGSYLAHGSVAYNGTYGVQQLEYMILFCWLFDGTSFAMNKSNVELIHKIATIGVEPFIHNGNFMSMVKGRSIANFWGEEIDTGIARIPYFAMLGDMDQTGATLDYAPLIKNWMDYSEKTDAPYYKDLSLFAVLKSQEIAAGAGKYTYSTEYMQFPIMDKMVARSENFALALSMYSERTMNYEYGNGQNSKGWHTSDGMTFIYDADVNKYNDNFWCTVNSYRLPGTTVGYRTNATKANTYGIYGKSLAGGAELGDGIGMSVQRVYDENIDAKKAWLVLGDKFVSFGAGITAANGNKAETIIENLKINGDNSLIANGSAISTEIGWSDTLNDVSTLWIEGNVEGSNLGYYFPSRTTLSGIREARTGNWAQINSYPKYVDYTPHTRNYLTIYQDHGTVENATYAYVTLPGYTADAVATYGENPTVEILVNNENVQAARDTAENVTGFVFWNNTDGAVKDEANTVDGLTSYNSAVVIREETEDTLKLAISDFTWRNDNVVIDYDLGDDYIATEITSKSDNVKVLSLNPLRIVVDTEDAYGQTFYVTVKKASSENADILEGSIASLENYLVISEYREVQKTDISTIVAEGKAALASAEDMDAIKNTLTVYMNMLDAVKTDAELTEDEITACPGVIVDNEDPAVIKSGDMHTTESSLYYGGTANWTTSGSFKLTFTGSAISVIGAKTDDSGIFDIYIDDELVETVDFYQTFRPYDYQGILFRKTDLSYGEHTIRVVATKTKNVDATDYKIWLDSFVYGNVGHKYTSAITAPSYTSQGYTTHTCICGDTYTDSYVDAIGGDVSYSGTLASGYDWMIVSPGVLVISGSGDGIIAFDSVPTADDLSAIPWIEYAESITEIVIEEATGITGTSDYAFAGLPNLTSVTLPATFVDMSAEGIFEGGTALTSITNHGTDATDGVFDLRNISKINASAFVGLNGIIWVGNSDGIEVDFKGVSPTDILSFVSYPTCDAADDIRKYIDESGNEAVTLTCYSPEFDSNLTRSGTNYLDDGTTAMFTWIFDDATGVLTLTFTGKSSAYKATQGFADWKTIWMDAVKSIRIEGKAAYGKLQIHNLAGDSRGLFNGYENLQSIVFVNKPGYNSSLCYEWAVNTNKFGLFSDNPKLTTIALGEANLKDGVVDISKLGKITGSNTLIGTFKNSSSIEKVKLPSISTFTSIGNSMFEGCGSLSEVNIPANVKTIDANAFKNCISLNLIHIPSTVSSIDPTAFDGCKNLFITVETAEMYNTLKGYGYNVVIDLRETEVADVSIDLSQITTDITVLLATGKEDSFETYTAEALNEVFGDFENVNYYVYPTSNGATVVREMMKDNGKVAIKYYPESMYSELTRSGSSINGDEKNVGFVWSFDDDSGRLTLDFKLSSSRYMSTTEFIASWKPIWADAVYEIYSPSSIGKLQYHTGAHGIFDSYENLWRIWFKDDHFEIQNKSYATYGFFSNNPSLTTLGFGAAEPEEGVVNIAFVHKFTSASCSQNLFNGCESIKAVKFRSGTPTNLSAITNGMFANCSSLGSLTLPSYVTSISANAFKGCTSLKNLVLKNSAVKVDATAFNGADTKIICFDAAQVEAINASLESGETEAKAILMSGAINAEGISIRYKDYNGLRYIFSFDNVEKKDLALAGFTLREYGILVSSAANMANAFVSSDDNGAYITPAANIKKAAVYDSTYEKNDGYSGKILSISTAEKTMFAGTVTNFSEDNGKLEVYARAYAVYFDAEGNEYIYYCDYGDVSEKYKAASIFKVAYDMYKANAEGIRDAAVDEKAVWSILLLGADVEEIKETPIEGFENVTLTLVSDGDGNYLAFLKSNAAVSDEAVAAAKEKLTSSGYADVEVLPIVINK